MKTKEVGTFWIMIGWALLPFILLYKTLYKPLYDMTEAGAIVYLSILCVSFYLIYEILILI